jgi:hypothetical protein
MFLFVISALFYKYRSSEKYAYHMDHFIQIVTKVKLFIS